MTASGISNRRSGRASGFPAVTAPLLPALVGACTDGEQYAVVDGDELERSEESLLAQPGSGDARAHNPCGRFNPVTRRTEMRSRAVQLEEER
jgi:hypothetical protein